MSLREAIRVDRFRSLGTRVASAAEAADRAFVTCATQVEDLMLEATEAACLRVVTYLPQLSRRAASSASAIAQRTAPLDQEGRSVLVASVPAAAERTAAIFERLGEEGAQKARSTVTALFAPRLPIAERLNAHHRHVGATVVKLVREGLNAIPVGRVVRAQLRKARTLATKSRGKRCRTSREGLEG